MLDDEHLGRLEIELVGGLDADLSTHGAAVGTNPLGRGQFMAPRFTPQVVRRMTPTVRSALATSAWWSLVRRRRRRCRLGLGQFREQQRLVRIERLLTPATPQQQIEPLAHLRQLATIQTHGRDQFGDHLFQNAGVIGKFGGIEDGRR
jgi:hypothetical protein